MENPLSLRLIKEEQESSEKLLELLVSSTHSPKGRFSKENSYIMLKRKMETTKKENTVKLVLALTPASPKRKQCCMSRKRNKKI